MKLRGLLCFGGFMALIFFFTSGWLIILVKHHDGSETRKITRAHSHKNAVVGEMNEIKLTKEMSNSTFQDQLKLVKNLVSGNSSLISDSSVTAFPVSVKKTNGDFTNITTHAYSISHERPDTNLSENYGSKSAPGKKNTVPRMMYSTESTHGRTDRLFSSSIEAHSNLLHRNATLLQQVAERKDNWICVGGQIYVPFSQMDIKRVRVKEALKNRSWDRKRRASSVAISSKPTLDFLSFVQAYLFGDIVTRQVNIMEMIKERASIWSDLLARLRGVDDAFIAIKNTVSSKAIILLGCLDSLENTVAMLSVAYLEQWRTILGAHTCRSDAKVEIVEHARDQFDLDNIIISISRTGYSSRNRLELNTSKGMWASTSGGLWQNKFTAYSVELIDMVPNSWSTLGTQPWDLLDFTSDFLDDPFSWSRSSFMQCDYLIIFPDTLNFILDTFLPDEAEVIVAFAADWCGLTAFIEPDAWRFGLFWSTVDRFVGCAMDDRKNEKFEADHSELGKGWPPRSHSKSTIFVSGLRIVLIVLHKGNLSVNDAARTLLESRGTLKFDTLHVPCLTYCSYSIGFTLANLRMFQLSNFEICRLVASALKHNPRIDCIFSNNRLLRYDAGAFTGCKELRSYCRAGRSFDTSFFRRIECDRKDVRYTMLRSALPTHLMFSFPRGSMNYPDRRRLQKVQTLHSASRMDPNDFTSKYSLFLSHVASYHHCRETGWNVSIKSYYSHESQYRIISLSDKESNNVAQWWRVLKASVMARFSMLVVGDNLGMLSVKVARSAPSSTVVCRRFTNHDSVEKMARLLGAHNIMTASDDVTSTIELGGSPKSFTYTLLGAPNLIRYLENCKLGDWESRIGAVISAARHKAWIEIPMFKVLQILFGELAPNCEIDLSTRYNYSEIRLIERALDAVGDDRSASLKIITKYRISRIESRTRVEETNRSKDLNRYHLLANENLLIEINFDDTAPPHYTPSERYSKDEYEGVISMKHSGSVSVQALLDVGVRPSWKKKMLHSHLEDLAIWQMSSADAHALQPDVLHFGPHMGIHEDLNSNVSRPPTMRFLPPHTGKTNLHKSPLTNLTLWKALRSYLRESPAEGRNGKFSLLEWGSTVTPIAHTIAEEYPNATVVAIAGASRLNDWSSVGRQEPSNLIRCAGVAIDRTTAEHMYESPELARYSLLRLDELFTPREKSPSSMYRRVDESIDFIKQSSSSVLDIAFTDAYPEAKRIIGALISSALTSFIPIPSAAHVSIAMRTLFCKFPREESLGAKGFSKRSEGSRTRSQTHGHCEAVDFIDFEAKILERIARQPVAGEPNDRSTVVTIRGASFQSDHAHSALNRGRGYGLAPWPLARVDIITLTRRVHHHFDWSRDGHKRTYSMHIEVNESSLPADARLLNALRGSIFMSDDAEVAYSNTSAGSTIRLNTLYSERFLHIPLGHHVSNGKIMHVYLIRDEDRSYIPYASIRCITLIAAMRLGLTPELRKRAFSKFVKLPLYEDMAPWNIAFAGSHLVYIDYDTKNETYNADVAKVYRVLSVLMNFKRTVQDFDMCGPRARTLYGFSLVAECVRPKQHQGDCDYNSKYPVPCDDGDCHSDFISCLRSLAAAHERTKAPTLGDLSNPHKLVVRTRSKS